MTTTNNKYRIIHDELLKKLHALGDDETLSEEEYDEQFYVISEQLDKLTNADYESQATILHPNAWFKSFLSSFSDASHKRITSKQASIFTKKLIPIESKQHGYTFHRIINEEIYLGKYDGKVYEVKVFSDCGYLTVSNETVIDF